MYHSKQMLFQFISYSVSVSQRPRVRTSKDSRSGDVRCRGSLTACLRPRMPDEPQSTESCISSEHNSMYIEPFAGLSPTGRKPRESSLSLPTQSAKCHVNEKHAKTAFLGTYETHLSSSKIIPLQCHPVLLSFSKPSLGFCWEQSRRHAE